MLDIVVLDIIYWMGNSADQWTVVDTFPNYVVRRNSKGDQVQSHQHFFFTSQDLNHFIQHTRTRGHLNRHIPRLLGVETVQQKAICGQTVSVMVTIQRISSRLDNRKWAEKDILRALLDVSEGMEEVSKLYTPAFMLSPKMIAFNRAGQALFWFNEDFSIPYPQFPIKSKMSKEELEHSLLENLLELGQSVLTNKIYSLRFSRIKNNVVKRHTFASWRRMIQTYLLSGDDDCSISHPQRAFTQFYIRDKDSEMDFGQDYQYSRGAQSRLIIHDVKNMQAFSLKPPKTTTNSVSGYSPEQVNCTQLQSIDASSIESIQNTMKSKDERRNNIGKSLGEKRTTSFTKKKILANLIDNKSKPQPMSNPFLTKPFA